MSRIAILVEILDRDNGREVWASAPGGYARLALAAAWAVTQTIEEGSP